MVNVKLPSNIYDSNIYIKKLLKLIDLNTFIGNSL